MSDNPNNLDAILLESADENIQKQFFELLKEQKDTFELQKTHRCWYNIPTPLEYERMYKLKECPKCKGRTIVTIYRGNLGDSLHVECKWNKNCSGFKEYITDDGLD